MKNLLFVFFNPSFIRIIWTFLIINAISTLANGEESKSRIVNGALTDIRNTKSTVILRLNGYFQCGGSLITEQHVVTAAHCVENVSPSELMVVGGATYLTEAGIQRNVSKIIIPKEFNSKTFHKDVAVLKLSDEMSGDNIETIELCENDWKLGDSIDAYGWGRLGENENKESNELRTVKLSLVARKKCSKMFKRAGRFLTDTMFCAGDPNGKGVCFGDSGGPAIYQNQLCGIVSWGIGCARSNFPGVYTNVRSVRDFIEDALEY